MMNKISLGLSISSFVLILIMFVFGDVNLEFNEQKSVVVEQPKYNYCNPSHEYYDKGWVDIYNNFPNEWKVFSCAETYYIDTQIEYNMGLHSADSWGQGGYHHTHSYDIYGNMKESIW